MSGRTRFLASPPRLLALGLLPALLAVVLVPLPARAALNGYDVISEYATTYPPGLIDTGPDGNIWYSSNALVGAGAGAAASIVKADPSTGSTVNVYTGVGSGSVGAMALGSDHNMWVLTGWLAPGDIVQSTLSRVTSGGTVTNFNLPSGTNFVGKGLLTTGPDGQLWLAEPDRNAIAKIDVTTGSIVAEYQMSLGTSPYGITAWSDGNLWFTEAGFIGLITISGQMVEYPLPAGISAREILSAPDGYMYFTEGASKIGRVTQGAQVPVITEFATPAQPGSIATGPDGNLWFTESTNKLASMTSAGVVQEVGVPTPSSGVGGLALGPDGNLWFTEPSTNKIGKVGARHNALVPDKTAIGFGNMPVGTTSTQRVTLTNAGPDILAAFTPTIANDNATAGAFAVAADTCHVGPIAAGSTCYDDVAFTATNSQGTAYGTLIFKTDSGLATEQSVAVALSVTVVSATCSFTALSTDAASPQNIGTTVTLSATSTVCPNPGPLYSFFIRSADGVWSTVQVNGTASSYVWNTAGLTAGTYLLKVSVVDAKSTTTADAFDTRTYTLIAPNCSSANVTSDVVSPQAVGTTISFTATSIGCPLPLYQWWVNTAGAWAIQPGHDFAHSSATFAWNTSGLAGGTYQVGFWAKQNGSASTYDTYSIATYTLTVTNCSAVNLATSAASPQATGSSITLTPTGVGCPSAQYRFWIRDAAGGWRMVQDYGVGATYVWSAASTPVDTNTPATFLVGVWARQPGSTNTYDAFAFNTFSLTSAPTCMVNIVADKTSPQPLGTGATWTATTSSCVNTPVQYQFWVNPPGGTWGIVQPYGSGTTYAWTGATAGTYQVGVWVRQAGSTAAYDNFAFVTFTLTPATTPQVCQSVNVGASPGSPSPAGSTATLTASGTAGCSNPEFRWWVRDIAGAWAVVQDYGPAGTFTWQSATVPGIYQVGVWARQAGSTASYEVYSFITYTLSGFASRPCSSVGISSNVPPPQATGTDITFTASALGCGTPNYRFFLAPPGLAFVEVQPYSLSNTFIWHTGGLNPGEYQVGVWARQSGSAASYDVYAFITFVVQQAPCSAIALWPSHSVAVNTIDSQPPQPMGSTITWRASVGGCGAAEYRFYVISDSSNFGQTQEYSSASTFAWSPAGWPAGLYRIGVSARIAGSNSSLYFNTFAVTTFWISP